MRLMVQLGRHFGTGPASLAEIAAEEDLPRAYTSSSSSAFATQGW